MPIISTRTTNVELTSRRRELLNRKLWTVAKVLPNTEDAHFDVVIRQHRSKITGDQFCLSVKLTTPQGSYMTVATAHTFRGAVSKVRSVLKRQLAERSKERRHLQSWQIQEMQMA